MDTGKKKAPVLPYDLRVEIWNLIDQGIGTAEIIQKLYSKAPVEVSEGQFEFCIHSIKALHTLGQRPSKR